MITYILLFFVCQMTKKDLMFSFRFGDKIKRQTRTKSITNRYWLIEFSSGNKKQMHLQTHTENRENTLSMRINPSRTKLIQLWIWWCFFNQIKSTKNNQPTKTHKTQKKINVDGDDNWIENRKNEKNDENWQKQLWNTRDDLLLLFGCFISQIWL